MIKKLDNPGVTNQTVKNCEEMCSIILANRAICDLPVSEQEFVENLHELSHKIKVFKEQSYKGATACNDVKDTLDKLKTNVSFYVCSQSF